MTAIDLPQRTKPIPFVTGAVGAEAHEAFFRAPEGRLNAAAYQMMVPVFGEGVQFGAPAEIERQQLRIQYQGLRYEKMINYAALVAREVEEFIAEWGDEGEKDFYEAFTELTLKTSTRCLLGSELRYQLTHEFEELYGDLDRGLDPAALRDPYQAKEAYLACRCPRLPPMSDAPYSGS
jgi:sterol 14-demethylase